MVVYKFYFLFIKHLNRPKQRSSSKRSNNTAKKNTIWCNHKHRDSKWIKHMSYWISNDICMNGNISSASLCIAFKWVITRKWIQNAMQWNGLWFRTCLNPVNSENLNYLFQSFVAASWNRFDKLLQRSQMKNFDKITKTNGKSGRSKLCLQFNLHHQWYRCILEWWSVHFFFSHSPFFSFAVFNPV